MVLKLGECNARTKSRGKRIALREHDRCSGRVKRNGVDLIQQDGTFLRESCEVLLCVSK